MGEGFILPLPWGGEDLLYLSYGHKTESGPYPKRTPMKVTSSSWGHSPFHTVKNLCRRSSCSGQGLWGISRRPFRLFVWAFKP